MIAEIASAGASLLGNVLGSVFSNNSSKKVARENRAFALDMWNKNNEYNTPLAQMQRLKEAGLNPNLMYGQGTTGNSSAPAKADGRQPTQYDFMPAMQMYQQMRMNESQRQLQKSQTELNHAQAAKTQAETDSTKASTQNTQDTIQFNRESRPKILQKYDLENQSISLSNENLNKINAKIEADINQIKANTQLTSRQADVAKASLGKIAIEVENAVKQGRSIDLQQVEQQFKNDLWRKGINPSSTGTNGLIDWLRNNVLDKFKDAWKYYPKIPR
ncbi:hypothetical protein CMU66_02490 [Elizabethkingia anophelis]|nr:hypothetical protein [Elizabethkingia anophelis]MDV3563072.1 hypothetical protein [Elizabethkingia anophelis]MDV3625522.1 hypothetical protein [Elizabethkingia anophelis]MDV3642288.1 hypothetical protein [Elizabethkingia anophelis]MDV3655693.1 hypothetical protein [Elizabethkingia anophelis]